MNTPDIKVFFSPLFCLLLLLAGCRSNNKNVSSEAIDSINLKKGDVVLCGPPDKEFGDVGFVTSCSEKVKKDFELAIALLHSFEYDEAEKVFAKIIAAEPECAMAYWGVAMSNYHPLWAPPTKPELEKGAKAVAIAQSITQKTKRESDYIDAIGSFYTNRDKTDHLTSATAFEKAMEQLQKKYPADKEAAIFYALALTAAASPTDKTFTKQKKAGAILNAFYAGQPNHPGVVHYIIHTFDSPELAELALPAARKYASVAPSSAHAQHMPSHIFTRLGLWDECIKSNLASVYAAQCYAQGAGIKGHWDEELHGLDYLLYAYLQSGQNEAAKKQWDYLKTINEVQPANFKVAYAFAAIPARYVLENKLWKEATALQEQTANFSWQHFPWQKAITHFARAMGLVNSGNTNSARTELKELQIIYDTLINQKDQYKASQVQIQLKTAEAWILFKEGKNNEALTLMEAAANMEDGIQKHPVTPGEIIPARELLGDMLLQMNQPAKAMQAYEANLKTHPNRFNGLYAAGLAAERCTNTVKAKFYYNKLLNSSSNAKSTRAESVAARLFLDKNK